MITLCHIDDIAEGRAKGFEINETRYFAVKRDDQLFVYKNACPHLGIPLEWHEDSFLDADGDLIQCATHGALFLIETGECVSGPCMGERLTAIEILVENGAVMIAA